jgi:hypothetical protein
MVKVSNERKTIASPSRSKLAITEGDGSMPRRSSSSMDGTALALDDAFVPTNADDDDLRLRNADIVRRRVLLSTMSNNWLELLRLVQTLCRERLFESADILASCLPRVFELASAPRAAVRDLLVTRGDIATNRGQRKKKKITKVKKFKKKIKFDVIFVTVLRAANFYSAACYDDVKSTTNTDVQYTTEVVSSTTPSALDPTLQLFRSLVAVSKAATVASSHIDRALL